MKKILIIALAFLIMPLLGACDIKLESYTPENPPPKSFQFSAQDIADYCNINPRQLRRIRTPSSKNFSCVKMYADQGHVVAMKIVGKAYRRQGQKRKARYYLSLAKQY